MTDQQIAEWSKKHEAERTREREYLASAIAVSKINKSPATRKWNASIKAVAKAIGGTVREASTGSKYISVNGDIVARFSDHGHGINTDYGYDVRKSVNGTMLIGRDLREISVAELISLLLS